jgi:hypothetical protein
MPLSLRALALVLLVGSVARAAPTKGECAAAHQEAQRLRQERSLRAARQRLLVCSREPCPAVVQAECVPWLADVERAMPSVVFEARLPDGSDASDTRVRVDGALVQERLDGRAIDLDPGEHVVRFERADRAPVERRVVVAEGEKARVLRLDLLPPPPAPVPAPAPLPAPAPPETAPMPWTFYALGGAGLIAFGGFAIFGLAGLRGERDLEDCSPNCAASRIDAVRRDYVVADVFLAASVVAVSAAAIVALTRPSSPPPRAAYLPSFARSMLK